MQLLLSHWHCILPAAVLILGMVFLNRGSSEEEGTGEKRTHITEKGKEKNHVDDKEFK